MSKKREIFGNEHRAIRWFHVREALKVQGGDVVYDGTYQEKRQWKVAFGENDCVGLCRKGRVGEELGQAWGLS